MKQCYVVLTGIEPFGDFNRNPSKDIALMLSGRVIHGYNLIGMTIPYDSRKIQENLIRRIKNIQPSYVLMMGQSFNAHQQGIVLERRANNYVNYEKNGLWDATGYRPPIGKIVEGDRDFRTTTIEVYNLISKLKHRGVLNSEDAGSNFCNELYYRMLKEEQQIEGKWNVGSRTLFAHVAPYPSEDVQACAMHLAEQKQLVFDVLEAMLPHLPPLHDMQSLHEDAKGKKEMRHLQTLLKTMETNDLNEFYREALQIAIRNGGTSFLSSHAVVKTEHQRGVDFLTNRPLYHSQVVKSCDIEDVFNNSIDKP